MKNNQKFVGISLALGDIYTNGGAGELIHPIDGAIARYRAVNDYLEDVKHMYNIKSIIICTAGYSKENPRVTEVPSNGISGRIVSLSRQLFRYCSESGLRLPFARPICWSTRNEVRIGIKTAIRQGFATKEENVTVIIASNLTHLFRIWLYVKMYTPKRWKFKLIRSRHQFTLMSHLLEIPKLIRDFDYALRVWSRLDV